MTRKHSENNEIEARNRECSEETGMENPQTHGEAKDERKRNENEKKTEKQNLSF